MAVDFEKRVSQYVQMRDKIKELDDAHKEKMAPFREMLETLGNTMLKGLQDTSAESVKTAAGTVYISRKSMATVADMEQFRSFIIGEQQWDLTDMRANAPAIATWIDANRGHLPPGINFTTAVNVGVRRK